MIWEGKDRTRICCADNDQIGRIFEIVRKESSWRENEEEDLWRVWGDRGRRWRKREGSQEKVVDPARGSRRKVGKINNFFAIQGLNHCLDFDFKKKRWPRLPPWLRLFYLVGFVC